MKKIKCSKNFKSDYKKRKDLAYICIGVFIFVVWLMILLWKVISAYETGGDLLKVCDTIVNGIFDNILGILPPIIFFDLILQYFQQDKIFEEMTEQITGTIMSKSEIIKSFDDEAKKRFLNATVNALVDQNQDEVSVAIEAIQPYIDNKFDVRKDFDYFLDIRDCSCIDEFDSDKYMLICEDLSYELFYNASKPIRNSVKLAFFVENVQLDKKLRDDDSQYIIREALNIDPADFCIFQKKNENNDNFIEYIHKVFSPRVYIDDSMWNIKEVIVEKNQLTIEFVSPDGFAIKDDEKSNKISVYFQMPQLKANTSFLAAISQPTFNPTIRLSYPALDFDVKSYLFFNKNININVEKAEQGRGCCNIRVKDNWVHPMSGVVFLINNKLNR